MLSQILPLMRQESWFQLVPVASEAEAVTIAATDRPFEAAAGTAATVPPVLAPRVMCP